MSLVEMTWRDALFAHWPVEPSVVDPRLPDDLDVDTHDGRAWLGVVGFLMEDVRLRGMPPSLGFTFPELNLRTYVTHDGTPGIYFFNLDAGDRLGVAAARRLVKLPYYTASMRITDREEGFRFRSRRVERDAPPLAFDADYAPLDEPLADRERAEFLTERYRFYTAGVDAVREGYEGSSDRLWIGEVRHDPWTLAPAALTVRRNGCFRANRFETPEGDPLCHYAPGVEVRADRLRRV
ncbi:YqjF family protein [Halomarina salina]|uniref:YqjF family protein n=1 Tax=Halomarina salina TaxID=1872699 RepID=A0ABD5RS40_9EURY|nr:DUF2071 domain-containing protein [Halomarina salina]